MTTVLVLYLLAWIMVVGFLVILGQFMNIIGHCMTLDNGCTQCAVIHLLIIITELNQVINHLLLRAILIVTIAIVTYASNMLSNNV